MTTAGRDARKQVLHVAGPLTGDPSDVVGLMTAANALLYWLEEAPDEADLQLRQAVMDLHHANAFYAAARTGLTAGDFLAGCRALHDFVTAVITVPDVIGPEAAA
jgi:hypothetical protein